jgi:hypothetical protein
VGGYSLFGSYHIDQILDLRVAIGIQTWGDGQGSAPYIGPRVLYRFGEKHERLLIDGVFISYDGVFFLNL